MKKSLILILIGTLATIQVFSQAPDPFAANGYSNYVLGGNWSLPSQSYNELGVRYVRLIVNWRSVSADSVNWDPFDNWADFYATYNVEPIVVLQCGQAIPDTSSTADTTGWSYCEKMNWINLHDNNMPSSSNTSYYPQDTALWVDFLQALVERYDGDGFQDYANLDKPFKIYQFDPELPRAWCKKSANWESNYVDYVNLSYNAIKTVDSTAIVKTAGQASFDYSLMYHSNSYNLDSVEVMKGMYVKMNTLTSILDTASSFQENDSSFMYIMENAKTDVYDIHCYGHAEWMPFRASAIKELFGNKPVWSLEGGGPFRNAFEIFNPDTNSGYVSPALARENAAYIIRYYIGGIGSGFQRLAWQIPSEFGTWGQTFYDLDLISPNDEKKPAYWTYSGLSSLITNFDSIVPVADGRFWNNPEVTGYLCYTPTKQFLFIWKKLTDNAHITDTTQISLTGVEKQHIYPTVMGDSLWNEVTYNLSDTNTFQITREPIVLESNSFVLAAKEYAPLPEKKLNIYPNPAADKLYIRINDVGAATSIVRLMDMKGQVVHQKKGKGNEMHLSLGHLQNGVYILMIQNEAAVYRKKIVISE